MEVWRAGRFPTGVTPTALAHAHPSVEYNPIIAAVVHRAGLIEKWGHGTNRVVEMCRAAGVNGTKRAEISGAAVVTFRVAVAMGRGVGPGQQWESPRESRRESTPPIGSAALHVRVVEALPGGPVSRSQLARALQ